MPQNYVNIRLISPKKSIIQNIQSQLELFYLINTFGLETEAISRHTTIVTSAGREGGSGGGIV